MKDIALNRFMRLLKPLSSDLKLELISKISESLKVDLNNKKSAKENLLEDLHGSWSDVGDDLTDDILKNRSVSDRNISFD
ncbi:MAG: hypothetical protein ACI85O_002336 [Saprospiraceae bacterium]|jgi:hypothetical protein